MPRLFTILLLFFSVAVSAQFNGLVVNEFSQGDQGSREYIELLVMGKRTCTDSTADLRGWIVDDQNGWYGTTSITSGHYRFKDVPAWGKVPIGAIILLYNSASGQKNLSITLPDDPTDANNDLVYVVPINSSAYLEEHDNEPSTTSTPAYAYPPASSTTGYNGTSNTWNFHIAMTNGSDVICTVSPQTRSTHHFSIGYGFASLPPYKVPTVSVPAVNGGFNCYLSSGQLVSAADWVIAAVPSAETPGLPNGGGNTVWITSMRTTPKSQRTFATACATGSYTFFGQTFTTTGAYSVLGANAAGCIDTNDLYVVVRRTETKDTTGCDSVVYKGTVYKTNTTFIERISSAVINCDSLVRTVHIFVRKSSASTTKVCIGGGQTYSFNGQSYSASGHYTATFTNAQGCDSVANLHLVKTVFDSSQLSGCGSVTFNGQLYSASTVRYDTVKSLVIGCDSVVRKTTIVVNQPASTSLNVCTNEGQPYDFGGTQLTMTGSYTKTFKTIAGCDSLVRLHLTVAREQRRQHTGCDSVWLNGNVYYASQIVQDTLRSVSGCDSLLRIDSIVVNRGAQTNLSACLLPGATYNFNGQLLSASGQYRAVFKTSSCDSVVNLSLVVAVRQAVYLRHCKQVLYNGVVYTSSSAFIDTIKSVRNACDSVYRAISILIQSPDTTYTSVCRPPGGSYLFNSQLLTASGTYRALFKTAGGCDSAVQLTLMVATAESQSLAGCGFVWYNNVRYTASTIVTDTVRSVSTSCDSVVRRIAIVVNPVPAIATSGDKIICLGNETKLFASSPGASLRWTGFAGSDSVVVSPNVTTVYSVTATTGAGCVATASVTVTVQAFSLVLSAPPSPPPAGLPVSLVTTANVPYSVLSWQPSIVFANQSAKSQTLLADSLFVVTVIARSSSGCNDTASINLVVLPLDDIYVPSAFTPNGDGKNDEVRVMGSISELDFRIFNRWGQPVFQSRAQSEGWRGNTGGVAQAAGVYVYLLKAKKRNGKTVEKKGTVVLIR